MEEEIFYGELPLVLSEELEEGEEGELDSLDVEILVEYPGWKTALLEAGYARKQQVAGYFSMWVERVKRGEAGGSAVECSLRIVGLLEAGEKRKRSMGVNGEQVSVGPDAKVILAWDKNEEGEEAEGGEKVDKVKRRVEKLDAEGEVVYIKIATPSGLMDRWTIRQAAVTVTDRYFTTEEPDMTVAGGPSTPPNAPEVPGNPWTSYSEPMRGQHPNGWVLDSREPDELFRNASGGGLWAVTDTYGFYYPAIPD